MKICVAQTKALKGNIDANIKNHISWIDKALTKGADVIIFPELSLTGYEPSLVKDLVMDQKDSRLTAFQSICDANDILIGVGVPTKSETGICISMLFFQPNKSVNCYSKQILHLDELDYFVPGKEQLILTINGCRLAPAICYESQQTEHVKKAVDLGAEIYLASVAKAKSGVEKACDHFHKVAKQYNVPVLMANSVGLCDNFESAGRSGIWNTDGVLLNYLGDATEGILIFDSKSAEVVKVE